MALRIALFGIHKLLSRTLQVLEREGKSPVVVIFPAIDSDYHQLAEEICKRNSIPMLRPDSVKDAAFGAQLENLSINRIIVAGYHQIFPQALLNLAGEGAINCHGGLLPEERGPIPWKWAIYENKPYTGVTFHRMTSKVDQGEILIKELISLESDETSESLFDKVAEVVAAAVPKFFSQKIEKEFDEAKQIETQQTYRGQVPEELTEFDLSQTAEELHRRVRAFSPRPGVFLKQDNQTILVRETTVDFNADEDDVLIFRAADGDIAVSRYELLYPETL